MYKIKRRIHMYTLVNEENYSDGQVIFKEGSSGDWVYVIISGQVEISRTIENKKYVLEVLKEGDVFGEMAFLGHTKRTAAATSVGDTIIGVIDRDSMDKEFNKLSSGFRAILSTIVTRFRSMNDRISGFDARCEPRVPKKLSLAYKDKASFLKAYTKNISNGGLFVRTSDPPPKGTLINLQLQLPGLKEHLKIDCSVVWNNTKESKASGMGLQFDNMSESDRKTLQTYLKSVS
jgi:uncharacterized protein (TIGR02266 family)